MATTQNYKARILTASAGSGKTYSLAREYVYNTLRNQPGASDAEFNPNVYRTILAVTFTNTATEEMKSRILKQINNLATGEQCEFLEDLIAMTSLPERVLRERAMRVRSAILHDYSRFAILTNDTFFQRIVRAFAKELNIDMDYAIELDTAPVAQKGVDMLIEQAEGDKELQQWLVDFAEENIESGRQWDIKRVILKLKNELFSEQTKHTIGRKIDREQLRDVVMEYISEAEQQVAAFREVGKSAVRLIESSGYDHSLFPYKFTSYFDKVAKFNGDTTAPSKTFMSQREDEVERWFKKGSKLTQDKIELVMQLQSYVAQVVEEYPRVKYLYNSCQLLRKNYRSFALLHDLYTKVADICREQNTMLLAQTKHTISQFVREPSDAPFIYEKVGNSFERFMIDEFQDTSLMEWQNFLPLLRNAIAQSEDVAVLIVGDIKQSIYRWRGSDWNILSSIAPAQLSEGNTPISEQNLEDNYRSLPNVVRFNNVVMHLATQSLNVTLNNTLTQAYADSLISKSLFDELHNTIGEAYHWSRLRQNPKRKPLRSGYVRVTAHTDEEPDIIGCIRTLVHEKHYKPCDITILVRKNDEAERIASLLLDAGAADESMRFGIMTQEALKLNSSTVVQFTLAVMKYAVDRTDVVSLAVFNRYNHNFDLYHNITEEEMALFDRVKTSSPEEAFELIMIHYPKIFKGQQVYTDAFHEQIVKFCAGKVADLSLFIKWWGESGYNKSVTIDKDVNAIEIMTIHKAKGLENNVVIIPYCSWPFVPKATRASTVWTTAAEGSRLNTDTAFPVAATAEAANSIFSEGYYRELIYNYVDAINLLYVALTRPKEQLHIFFPAVKEGKDDSKGASTVGELLYQVLDMARISTEESDSVVYQYGEFNGPIKSTETKQGTVALGDCEVSPYRMKLKLSSQRFFEAREGAALSPQQEGIVLHGIMERATSREDIYRSIEQLVIDGVLSEIEAEQLQEQIEQTLSHSLAAEWFDCEWEEVHTEGSIISKDDGIKRPDRVMIDGNRAVVVDYKFGEYSQSHVAQVKEYISLLARMGYSVVEGFVWYVREGKIVEVV